MASGSTGLSLRRSTAAPVYDGHQQGHRHEVGPGVKGAGGGTARGIPPPASAAPERPPARRCLPDAGRFVVCKGGRRPLSSAGPRIDMSSGSGLFGGGRGGGGG